MTRFDGHMAHLQLTESQIKSFTVQQPLSCWNLMAAACHYYPMAGHGILFKSLCSLIIDEYSSGAHKKLRFADRGLYIYSNLTILRPLHVVRNALLGRVITRLFPRCAIVNFVPRA